MKKNYSDAFLRFHDKWKKGAIAIIGATLMLLVAGAFAAPFSLIAKLFGFTDLFKPFWCISALILWPYGIGELFPTIISGMLEAKDTDEGGQ